ncbi:transporter substrate-binding domain-containing protein [Pseudomonas sp. CC120222-01a]|uniref:transporter substrate-binding domain-containing protein n=1 Tax=Pseudomonas sp. CC120222-01a TaxID=1378075 RepID=UPI000D84759D|nr:transporter substrate-binding domain-containing protein [Pseudomonas sp. CC120222-01a]PVZ39050.1 amino acid ABC transporter substrate-binding protein (PAAT family) [Pseudomonas sp. CC120222-01a]
MNSKAKLASLCFASLIGWAASHATVAAADVLSRIRDSQVLTLGYMDGFAPFSSGNEQAPQGYTVELCRAVAERLRQAPGFAGLQVRWRALPEEEVGRTLSEGQVDLFCTPAVETLARRKSLDFSIPVFTSGLAVMVRRDAPPTLLGPLNGRASDNGPRWRATINAGLSKHSFAVLHGTVSSDWARQRIRQLGLQSTLQEVPTYQEGVRRVVAREVDAFLGDRMVLLGYQAGQAEREQLWVPDRLFEMNRVALAMARGDEDFRLLVDSALSQALAGQQGEALFKRYLGAPSAQDRLLQSLYPLPD